MTKTAKLAAGLLFVLVVVCAAADLIAPANYATQFRDEVNAPPSAHHWLGTDAIGRDRFSRVLFGTRISLLLAPAAALISTLLAALIGGVAGLLGGIPQRVVTAGIDLVLSLPWFFLLILARAMLPLNVSPLTSVAVTFLLLGLLGWAASARILCAGVNSAVNSDYVLHARALGIGWGRLLAFHVLPTLKPLLFAQFWISVPVFILTEANLGILGLGVAEPMPSWGSLLREIEPTYGFGIAPWKLVPLVLLVIVVVSFQAILSADEVSV
jgi:ABC-type dipeptide/oligopeptide/nickel transport system permease subunit